MHSFSPPAMPSSHLTQHPQGTQPSFSYCGKGLRSHSNREGAQCRSVQASPTLHLTEEKRGGSKINAVQL